MLPETKAFVIRGDDGEEYGPVGLDEMRDWVRENRAGLGTTVRLDEPGALWQPWQYYPELVALLAEAHGTSLIPGQPGWVVAPLGLRIMSGLFDFVLSTILAYPLLYLVKNIFLPDWSDEQFIQVSMQVLFHPEIPVPQSFMFYEIYGNLTQYTVLAFYMAGFHAAHGQTPAKALLGIRVIDRLGHKPNFVKALLRAFMLLFSFYLYGIPLAYALFNPQRRTFHDFVAGTYVVKA